MIQLKKEQREMLWWSEGPYSEARLTFETRILDDEVSRTFINVEVSINPTTYDICKQHMKRFADNPILTQLFQTADYRWKSFWYVSMAFSSEYNRDDKKDVAEILKEAQVALEYSEASIIELHKFVMVFLEIV